jgi:hypothetical protein
MPLLLSALLIVPMVSLAQTCAAHEAKMLAEPLRSAHSAYVSSIAAR